MSCMICDDSCDDDKWLCPSCEKNVAVLPDFLYWLADKSHVHIDKDFVEKLVTEYNHTRGHSWWTR